MEPGALLPGGLSLQPSVFSQIWSSVANLDTAALSAELAKAGWTFFYMAGIVRKHAFGFDEETRTRTALGRVIREVRAQHCNCLELTRLVTKSFLGIPYVSITAHARHIQDGSQFHVSMEAAR
jgi:hypothetical protein